LTKEGAGCYRARMATDTTEKIVHVSFERRIPVFEKRCQQCGKPFAGVKKSLYCGTRCRNQAAYARNPEKYRGYRRKSYLKQKQQGQPA
jgi:hypothetical protein